MPHRPASLCDIYVEFLQTRAAFVAQTLLSVLVLAQLTEARVNAIAFRLPQMLWLALLAPLVLIFFRWLGRSPRHAA